MGRSHRRVLSSPTQQHHQYLQAIKLPTPPNINLKGDLRENWKQIWDAYALVTGLNQQSNEFQVATFITCIGQEALKAHNGLPFKTDDEKKT